MTHFVGLVMCETEDEIENLVADQDENLEVDPYFRPVEGEDLERMVKFYTDKEMKEAAETGNDARTVDQEYLLNVMEDWNGGEGVVEDGVIGYMSTYNPESKWDWYEVGGRWGDEVPLNNCLAKDIPEYFKEWLPSVIVTKEHGWQSAKEFGWFGSSSPTGNDDVVEDILAANPEARVWVVDFHI